MHVSIFSIGFFQTQERNWLEHQNQLDRQQARSSAVDYNLVTIHCSKCKAQLCCASDLRIRGSNYICIAEDFEDRILFRETSQQKEFATEIHLGSLSNYSHLSVGLSRASSAIFMGTTNRPFDDLKLDRTPFCLYFNGYFFI